MPCTLSAPFRIPPPVLPTITLLPQRPFTPRLVTKTRHSSLASVNLGIYTPSHPPLLTAFLLKTIYKIHNTPYTNLPCTPHQPYQQQQQQCLSSRTSTNTPSTRRSLGMMSRGPSSASSCRYLPSAAHQQAAQISGYGGNTGPNIPTSTHPQQPENLALAEQREVSSTAHILYVLPVRHTSPTGSASAGRRSLRPWLRASARSTTACCSAQAYYCRS